MGSEDSIMADDKRDFAPWLESLDDSKGEAPWLAQTGPGLSLEERAWDVPKSAGIGLAQGAIGVAGMPGDVTELARRATGNENITKALRDKLISLGAMPSENPPEAASRIPTSQDIQGAIEKYTGPFYEPKTPEGAAAAAVASHAPNLAFGPGGLGRRAIFNVATPALMSETLGNIPKVKGTKAEPWMRAAAEIVSPTIASRILSPFTSPQTRRAAVNVLENEGVDTTAGQRTGSRFLRYRESELGGASAENFYDRQANQFTNAALRRIGEQRAADEPITDVVDRAFTRLGHEFDTLAGAYTLQPDQRLIRELGQARNGYERLVAPNQRVPGIQGTIDDIVHQISVNGWTMPGDVYQTLRSQLARDVRSLRTDPNAQRAMLEIQGALDGAMERTINNMNPADLGAWREARRQYRNLMVIERAVSGAGEAAAAGQITPARLRAATVSLHGLRNYARGQGDFTELARSGEEVLSPLPNSGTAQRWRAHAMPAIMGAVGIPAGAELIGAEPPGGRTVESGLGALGGLALSRFMGSGILRNPLRSYLANRVVQGDRDTARAAALRALLSAKPRDQGQP